MKESDTQKLPKGWEIKRLGEALEVLRNGVNCQQDKKGIGDKITRIESISTAKFDINKVGYAILSPSDKDKYRLHKGDILFSHINSPIHVGKTALIESQEEIYQGVNLLLMRPHFFLDTRYFNHYLKFLFQKGYWLTLCKQSVNQASVNQQDIKKVDILYPRSLSEQQRIVQIVDEAFEKIDTLKGNAEKNLQNAKKLFQSALTEELKPKEGWDVNKLSEISTKIGSGATPRGGNKSYKSEGISLVRSMNVHDFEFRDKNLAFIDEQQAKDLNNVTLQENDVLFNITGASVTRCCIIPKEYLPARVNQHVSIIRLKKDIIVPIFLNLLLTSKYYKDQLLSTGEQGATRQAITKVQLEAFRVAYPKSIKEQQTIVEHLDALSAYCKGLEVNYQKTIAQCEEMKKAVLGKAFRGEL